ncbi:protein LURP-one-related 7 [Carex littledalei]|uniref:Protein LURP-one-related 7 n=1 Tax=Carex littledalei TaxID=544730 RepID=A0A833R175_9POAL|nr:protein LURP-one-related 7 [Carex littledalei]
MASYPVIPAPWEIPVDYKITKSPFPFSPRHLTVCDSGGSLAYRVIDGGSSSTSAGRRVMTLFDASGATLITVVHEEDEWKAFRGHANEFKDLIFTTRNLSDSRFKTVIDVFLLERNLEDSKPSFRLTGNPFSRSCTITKEDTVVAQTYLLYKLNKRIYSRRKFRLTLYPRNDHVLVLAMLITFFGKS